MLKAAAVFMGSLPLGAVAAVVVHRLGDGKKRRWVLPSTIGGQVGLGLWSLAVMPEPWLPATLLLGWALLALALIDQIDLRLPDALTLPLTGAGLLFAIGSADMWGHGLGALIGYGALTALGVGYRVWRGREGIGQGDAKLLAAAGAWMGWEALPSIVVIGCATALSAVAICHISSYRRTGPLKVSQTPPADTPIPFGAPLCCAIWLVWLYGPLVA